jgi:uncharacterized Zn finger protein (UPF0148 family)
VRFRTLQQLPYEAQSLPCGGCGSPLPVDPMGQQVFCPYCGASTAVPAYLKASAGAYHQQMDQARVLRSGSATHVRREETAARAHQWRTVSYLAIGATFVVPSILGMIGFAGFYVVAFGIAIIHAIFEPFVVDDLLLVLDLLFVVGLGVALLLLLVGAIVLWRVAKHRRRVRRATRAGYTPPTAFQSYQISAAQRAQGVGAASCSVCGGPVQFRTGQQRVPCSYCGATVMPCPSQKRQLVALAISDAQLAADLERYRAERDRLEAEKSSSSARLVYLLLVAGGTCMVPLAIALAVIVLVFRKLTSGVEDAIDDFAVSVGAELERGLKLPYDWLDAYWVGRGPENAQVAGGALALRWSTHTSYAGRPVLVTATSNWRDAIAHRVAIMLAHPARRSHASIARTLASPAAREAGELGLWVSIDDAGVALQGNIVPARDLTAPQLHRLVACAYGLSSAANAEAA